MYGGWGSGYLIICQKKKKHYEEMFQYIAKRKRIKGNCNTEQKVYSQILYLSVKIDVIPKIVENTSNYLWVVGL